MFSFFLLTFPCAWHWKREIKGFLTLLCLFSIPSSPFIQDCSNEREMNLISEKEDFTFPVIYQWIIAYNCYCQLLKTAKSLCSGLSWEGKFIQYNMCPLWSHPELLIRTNCRFWQKSRGQKVRKKHQLQLSADIPQCQTAKTKLSILKRKASFSFGLFPFDLWNRTEI